MDVLDIISQLRKHKVVPRLVNGRLSLSGETQSLPPELMELLKANKQQLCDFLSVTAVQQTHRAIEPVAEQNDYPVSNGQKRIWVLSQLKGGNTAYVITKGFYIKGSLNIEMLNR